MLENGKLVEVGTREQILTRPAGAVHQAPAGGRAGARPRGAAARAPERDALLAGAEDAIAPSAVQLTRADGRLAVVAGGPDDPDGGARADAPEP